MRVHMFPEVMVHSVYSDMLMFPPSDIEYIGRLPKSFNDESMSFARNVDRFILDKLKFPYFFKLNSGGFVHSCQKLLDTNSDHVIDIEHGNPFMGYTCVDKYKYRHFRTIVEHLLSRDNCKYILPWSESAKDAFEHNFEFMGRGFFDKKVRVVYPSVRVPDFFLRKERRFTFLFVGGSSMYAKGVLQVMEAFRRLTKKYDCDLIIVARDGKKLERLYGKLDNVYIYSRMQRGVLMTLLNTSHCFVMPSIGDTFGIVFLEAMARKVPIIAYDSFSAGEIIRDKINGLLLKPDRKLNLWFDEHGGKRFGKRVFHSQFSSYLPSPEAVNDLQNAMEYMICNDVESRRMGESGFKDVSEGRFSMKCRNDLLSKAYNGVL